MGLTLATNRMTAGAPINVKDYGAVGDGVTDDTAAIQAVIDIFATDNEVDRRAQTIYFPEGIYAITAAINFVGVSNITLKGASKQFAYDPYASNEAGTTTLDVYGKGSIIKATAALTTMLNFASTTSRDTESYYNAITDLVIDGNGLADEGLRTAGQQTIEDVLVMRTLVDGIVLAPNTNSSVLNRVSSNRNTGNGINVSNEVSGDFTTTLHVSDCNFRRNGGYGILCEAGADGAKFEQTVVESNETGGVKIVNTGVGTPPNNLQFDNMYLENNGFRLAADGLYEGNYSIIVKGVNASNLVGSVKFTDVNARTFSTLSDGTTTMKVMELDNCSSITFTRFSAIGTDGYSANRYTLGALESMRISDCEWPFEAKMSAATITYPVFEPYYYGYGPSRGYVTTKGLNLADSAGSNVYSLETQVLLADITQLGDGSSSAPHYVTNAMGETVFPLHSDSSIMGWVGDFSAAGCSGDINLRLSVAPTKFGTFTTLYNGPYTLSGSDSTLLDSSSFSFRTFITGSEASKPYFRIGLTVGVGFIKGTAAANKQGLSLRILLRG